MNHWLIKSFKYAWQGIQYCFLHEKNFRLELCIAAIVLSAGFFFNISAQEWFAILFCSSLVLSLEMINTAIEKLSNKITMETDPVIKHVKDIAAGSVLISSFISFIIGLIIFLPKIKLLLFK